MRLKGTRRPLNELATELSVEFIVEGGVRKDGEAIRITVHLVNARRDTELWSQSYDGTFGEVFAFQEAVAKEVVSALHLRFEPGRHAGTRAPPNPRAFDAYLRGRHEMGNWSRESSERALRFFSAGLEILGEDALLHAGLGHASFRLAHIVPGSMSEYLRQAAASAERSLALDPGLVTARVLSGLVAWREGRIANSLRDFKDAINADPDDADALTWAAFCFAEVGHIDFVTPHVRRLILVDPINAFTRFTQGFAALMSRRPREAIAAFERSLTLDPRSTNSIALAAFVDLRLGNTESARQRLQQLAGNGLEDVWTHLGIALQAAIDGHQLSLAEHVIHDSKTDETFAWWLAECHALLGENEKVLEWLEYALRKGFCNTAFLMSDCTALRPVWNDPPFRDWIARADRHRSEVLRAAGVV
jgi:tetratricopeptide (TPR) repeat protein